MAIKKHFSGFFIRIFASRFSASCSILALYIVLSTLIRISLSLWSYVYIGWHPVWMARVFITGFFFDLTIGLCFLCVYNIYLLLLPKRFIGTTGDRIFTFVYFFIILFIIHFSLLAEIPFWDEFQVRFNFIAVDYLIYTYEVIANINQSYPLPLIISVILLLIVSTFWILRKSGAFKATFTNKKNFRCRAIYTAPLMILTSLLLWLTKNEQAEFSNNLVINELGKNGVFSFFAAFRANELDYETFYPKVSKSEAYLVLKKHLLQHNQTYTNNNATNIRRITQSRNEETPNIILIAIESFSADFLKAFGNKDNITPNYDSLINQSIFFTNLYATGTRTVRGLEALTLCVPPTPGNSIVRRPDNQYLFSIATILKQKNYHSYFIYGGDGYFDNMNNFFAGQGFDIIDRDRGNPLSDDIKTNRYNIPDSEISFENAWGICDEDLYKQALKYADKSSNTKASFFQFIMTTSNHKPYTFANGKIELVQGNRNAAVRYTDYALGKFITDARTKQWFSNTVFVIVADHCASSAGKWEINIDKHHIPAIFYNLHKKPEYINRLTSQIDLMPTLFGYLRWSYNTELYGKDINQTKMGEERAFLGNYRTLGMLKENLFTQIDDRKRIKQFSVSEKDKSLSETKNQNKDLVSETIAYYQTASERFKNGKMKAQ